MGLAEWIIDDTCLELIIKTMFFSCSFRFLDAPSQIAHVTDSCPEKNAQDFASDANTAGLRMVSQDTLAHSTDF